MTATGKSGKTKSPVAWATGIWNQHHALPRGVLGAVVGERMARQHAIETQWTLRLLQLGPGDRVLEIGCGAGQALRQVMTMGENIRATGFDLSPAMVAVARWRNRRQIRDNAIQVLTGDMHALPFEKDEFDAIFSVQTLYFWRDPSACWREIHRVFRPGGRFVLTASHGRIHEPNNSWFDGLVHYSILPAAAACGIDEIRELPGPISRQFRTMALAGVKPGAT